MSPLQPSLLDMPGAPKKMPLGWSGAKFPLSKLDLQKIAKDSVRKPKQNAPGSARNSARRQKASVTIPSPRSYGQSASKITGNMRLISKTSRGWSWLSIKFRESRSNKFARPRKGELAPELVKAIWGAHTLRNCQAPLESFRTLVGRKVSVDPDLAIKKIRNRKRQQSSKVKTAESLMDILLQNWTYFEHAHGQTDSIENEVHAKYCENEFGHFLLCGGKQVHGQFSVHLHFLVKELRRLLTKLRSQILPTYYQELPAWTSPRLEEAPELELPPMPSMPQLYPIAGLAAIPSEHDENIPNDLQAPVFKSPIPREYPPLVLPEPLKVPPLKLPTMPAFTEDESSIDYDAYKEEPMPVFVLPPQEPLPVWVEPHLAELPGEPEYIVAEVIPPPVLESIPSFRLPLLDPRPCEKSYYEIGNDKRGICDGLCSKHGHRHHFVPGQHRKEPCFAKPPPLLALPPPPFPEAETIDLANLQIIPEVPFEPPAEDPIPPFQPPVLKEEPTYVPLPPPYLPPWKEPKPPPPIGWLAGQRPVFLIDCSAAMGGERMGAVQKCLRELFSPGGQVEVAATHFDMIMYSFDAWSYGEIENSYIYKQASGSRYLRPLEPMRMKTPSTLESALNWVARWRPAGTTNLWKAINLATSRTLADCIYLLSEGRSDKPVLILESLRKQAQAKGYSIPIHTVGLHTSKLKCRFLKRLSAVTGGYFMEYDFKHDQKSPEGQRDDLQDMLWAQTMIQAEQRKNAQIGNREDIKDILKRVENQYEPARLAPRLQAHKQNAKEQESLHQIQLKVIREENVQTTLRARQIYEQTIAEITERNKMKLQTAKVKWEEQIENARSQNKHMAEEILKWRNAVAELKRKNEQIQDETKLQFAKDLKLVEERNNSIMEKAKEQHAAEIERIRKKHIDALEDVYRRQKENEEKVAAINKASREEYEAAVAAIRESNAALVSRTRMFYEEKLESVKLQNARAIQEAQMSFVKHCEELRMENAKKKATLSQRLDDIKRRREETIAAHKLDVTNTISQHEEMVKVYNAMNLDNEAKARQMWKKVCEEIDNENMAAAKKAMEDFEAEQIHVQEENVKLVERRLALKRKVAEIVKSNDALVKKKKLEWKEACAKVEREHEQEVAKAKELHKRMVEEVKQRNAEKLQSSLLEHKAKVAAVESYNETVRPYVEASNAVRAEIRRVEAFLQCIADTILPNDRHIQEKNPTKSQLDKDLDLLAVSDVTLNTQMLIEALRSAYGKNWKTDKKVSQKGSSIFDGASSKTSLSGLIPMHPRRAVAHDCLDVKDNPRA